MALTDNHSSPLFQNAYADTLLGIGSFFSLLLIFLIIQSKASMKKDWNSIIFLFVISLLFSSLWTIIGIQFIVTLFGLFILFLFYFIFRKKIVSIFLVSSILIGGFVGLVVSYPYGGMMTASSDMDHLKTHVSVAPDVRTSELKISIRSDYQWLFPSNWKPNTTIQGRIDIKKLQWDSSPHIYSNINRIERVMWDVVRSFFFIIIGMYIFFKFNSELKNNNFDKKLNSFLFYSALIIILIGLIPATMIMYGGRPWEFLRFLNLGYFVGILLFAFAITKSYESSSKSVKIFLISIFLISSIGSVSGIFIQINNSYERLNLIEKINFIVSIPRYAK